MAELTDREDAFPVPAEQLFQRKIITLPRETWLVAMQFYRIGRHRGTDQVGCLPDLDGHHTGHVVSAVVRRPYMITSRVGG